MDMDHLSTCSSCVHLKKVHVRPRRVNAGNKNKTGTETEGQRD